MIHRKTPKNTINYKKRKAIASRLNRDRSGDRTRDSAVRGLRLSRLTNLPSCRRFKRLDYYSKEVFSCQHTFKKLLKFRSID